MSEELQDIEREIRSWTARPPTRSPRVARTRVLARIEERRLWAGWKLAAAAAVLVVGFALLVLSPETPSGPSTVASVDEPSPRILVYELASGTKLYLALAAPPANVTIPTSRGNSTPEGNG